MIPACLPPRDVSRPKVPPPPNACDTHAHVFGPAAQFPYAADRSYTPPDAPLEKYLGMLDAIGFARGVLVQGSAHGRDNSAMLDALTQQPDRLRGVAVADADVSPAICGNGIASASGACASIIFSATGNCIIAAACRWRRRRTLAPVMAELGWHLQLWIDVKDLPETIPALKSLGLPVVIDHMGRTDARAGTVDRGLPEPCCARSATAGAGPNCPARTASASDAPDYPDARPFHEALVRGQSGTAGVGRRLAASARRGRDARCRPSVRIVSGMDAGSADTAAHPRRPIPQNSMASRTESRFPMSVNNKRVFYVKYLAHQIYADILQARPDVRLDRLENDSPDDIAAPILAAAHAYQIGAARDELATHFHVDAGPAGARAEPVDRLQQWRRLRSRSMSMPAPRRACWWSTSPAAMPIRSPNTRWRCC